MRQADRETDTVLEQRALKLRLQMGKIISFCITLTFIYVSSYVLKRTTREQMSNV